MFSKFIKNITVSGATLYSLLLIVALFPMSSFAAVIFSQPSFDNTVSYGTGSGLTSSFTGTFEALTSGTVTGFQFAGTPYLSTAADARVDFTVSGGSGGSGSLCIIQGQNLSSQTGNFGLYYSTTTAPSQSACTFTAGNTYSLTIQVATGGFPTNYFLFQSSASSSTMPFFAGTNNGSYPPVALTNTRIISITPENGTTTASSSLTTLGYHVYISPEDVGVEIQMLVNSINNFPDSIGIGGYHENFYLMSTTSGDVYFSTTTEELLGVGSYNTKVRFGTNCYGLFGFDHCFGILKNDAGQLVERSSNWAVGYFSAFGEAFTNSIDIVDSLITAPATGSSTVTYLSSCSALNFDGTKCLTGLLIPSSVSLSQSFSSLYEGVLTRAPFGYISRLVDIFASTDSTMPPELSYTFGSSSAAELQGKTYSVQLWDHMDEFESIRTDDGQNKNIWDIVMPYFSTVVAFAVLFVLLEDLLGFRFMSDNTQQSISPEVVERGGNLYEGNRQIPINDYSSYTDEEWENAKKNRLL